MFFSDQGSELSSLAIHLWTHQKRVRIDLLMSGNEAWRREYNESRSQRALGERTSNEFACQFATSRNLISLQDVANSLASWYEKRGPLSF